MVFDLRLKVLMEVRELLVMIRRCLMKCLLHRLPSLVHGGKIFVSSNVEIFLME